MSKTRSPRIFWYSNHPAVPTGYGTQTAQVIRRMKKRGHDVVVHANFNQQMGEGRWNGMRILPQGFDTWSNDIILPHYNAIQAESDVPLRMVTLCDVWVLTNPRLAELDKIWSWTPVDHMNVPPQVLAWAQRPNVLSIAMSQHGKAAFDRAGVESVYIPHALEKHWKPSPMPEDPFPGRFLVSAINANKGVLPNRKAWGENLLAFALFAQKHDDALLYMHTDLKSPIGIDLMALVKACGISPKQVVFADQYDHRLGVSDDKMAEIMTRTDVLLAATMGEGFGLTVLEAQACGTRVIVSNFSAQPELVGDGALVEVQPSWNPTQQQWFGLPLVGSIVEGLEWAYQQGGGHSQQAVDFAADYAADKVFAEGWVPLLDGA
jgi:glycosyltransferase involved in cell wall biosynthesis